MMREPAFDCMLRIPHIIEEILLQFLPDWSDDGPLVYGVDHAQRTKAHRQMLAQLARVCKSFSQPALDILWKNLDEFGCLLHVLPWYRIDEWGHQTQNIIDEITPSQWQRFQHYAYRVRGLRWTESPSLSSAHWMVWALLAQQSGGQALLPHLQTLAIIGLKTSHAQALMLLIPPSLRTLKLSFVGSESTVITSLEGPSRHSPSPAGILLRLIAPRLSSLSNLCIQSGLTRDFPSRYLTCLTQFTRLKDLDLLYSGIVIDAETLQHISNMTSLRALSLQISLEESGASGPLSLGAALLELKDLHLSGSIDDILRVFEAAQFPNVTHFVLSVKQVESMGALKGALCAICGRVSRCVSEASLFIYAQIVSPTVSLADILLPYLSFRHMSTFSIEFDHYIARMDDQDALTFASAWPSLTYFRLGYPVWALAPPLPPTLPSQPTVAGLLAFAQRCPELYILSLPLLDIRTLPSPLSIQAAGQKAMRHLHISEYLGGDTANLLDLAAILHRLFPQYLADVRSVTMQNDVVSSVIECDARYRPVRITGLLVQAMQAQRRLLEDDGSDAGAVSE